MSSKPTEEKKSSTRSSNQEQTDKLEHKMLRNTIGLVACIYGMGKTEDPYIRALLMITAAILMWFRMNYLQEQNREPQHALQRPVPTQTSINDSKEPNRYAFLPGAPTPTATNESKETKMRNLVEDSENLEQDYVSLSGGPGTGK